MKTFILFLVISLSVIAINNLPVILGYTTQQESLVYLGRRDINSQDLYTYVSFIEQARQGHFLFQNLYMSEPQTNSLIRPLYVVIGTIASITGLTSIASYHIFRILLAFIFCFVLFQFLSLFFKSSRDRLIAFAFILVSAGFGGFIRSFAPNTTDLWIPESITFLALAEAPHFIFSLILMLLGFMAYLKAVKHEKYTWYFVSGAIFLVLSFEHPFNLFVTSLTILAASVYLLRQKGMHKVLVIGTLIILLFSALGLFYQFLETLYNPILRSWAKESLLPSPDPYNYLYGYGFIFILSLFGLEKALRERKFTSLFLVFWIVVAVILLYSSVPFQRRFSEGLHIPLAIMASMGLFTIASYVGRFSVEKAKKIVFWVVIIGAFFVVSVTSVDSISNDFQVILQDSPNEYYEHLLPGEVGALNFLKKETGDHDVILSNWFYGNIIPGLTGRKVYLGHRVQTPLFGKKVDIINTFLVNKNTKQANAFLKKNAITYIFLGKNDTMLQFGFKPDTKPYLIKIFDKNEVTIYKVR